MPPAEVVTTAPARLRGMTVRGEEYIRQTDLLRLLRETETANAHPAARLVCKLLYQVISEADPV